MAPYAIDEDYVGMPYPHAKTPFALFGTVLLLQALHRLLLFE